MPVSLTPQTILVPFRQCLAIAGPCIVAPPEDGLRCSTLRSRSLTDCATTVSRGGFASRDAFDAFLVQRQSLPLPAVSESIEQDELRRPHAFLVTSIGMCLDYGILSGLTYGFLGGMDHEVETREVPPWDTWVLLASEELQLLVTWVPRWAHELIRGALWAVSPPFQAWASVKDGMVCAEPWGDPGLSLQQGPQVMPHLTC